MRRILTAAPLLVLCVAPSAAPQTIPVPLVIDGNQAALGRLGVAAETVDSGAQAIEAVRTRNFDLVLMDCSMPDIDGFARRARSVPGRCRPDARACRSSP